MKQIDPNREKDVRSITSKKGIIDQFVYLECPEEGCDYNTGDWWDKFEDEIRGNYTRHWQHTHAPSPPDPLEDRWEG